MESEGITMVRNYASGMFAGFMVHDRLRHGIEIAFLGAGDVVRFRMGQTDLHGLSALARVDPGVREALEAAGLELIGPGLDRSRIG